MYLRSGQVCTEMKRRDLIIGAHPSHEITPGVHNLVCLWLVRIPNSFSDHGIIVEACDDMVPCIGVHQSRAFTYSCKMLGGYMALQNAPIEDLLVRGERESFPHPPRLPHSNKSPRSNYPHDVCAGQELLSRTLFYSYLLYQEINRPGPSRMVGVMIPRYPRNQGEVWAVDEPSLTVSVPGIEDDVALEKGMG